MLNNSLWKSFWKAITIWFLTGITGCTLVLTFFDITLFIEPYLLSLGYSSPAIAVATAVLYFVPKIQSIPFRVILSLTAILVTNALILGYFSYSGDGIIGLVIVPFIPISIIWFFLIAGVHITNPDTNEH